MSSRIQGVQEKWYKGIKYKSTLEADTAEVLDLMDLPFEYEKRTFTVFEGFKCPYQKRKVLDTRYKPDFWVKNIIFECKGFETPEWKLKRKLVYKYLMEKEPNVLFYQVNKHSWKKDLLLALDNNWQNLNRNIKVSSKPKRNQVPEVRIYNSIAEAMQELNLYNKSVVPILRSLTGTTQYVYGYNWKLQNLEYED